MKHEVAQAEADPEVSMSELATNVYVDNDKRIDYLMQITSGASSTRSPSFPRDKDIDLSITLLTPIITKS